MGFLVKAVKSVVKAVVGVVSKVVGGVFGFVVGGKSKKNASPNNLSKTLEPEAYRKIVFGKIAAPLDLRFWEVWGTNGTKFDEVIACATHRITSFLELYLEDDLAINAAGVVQPLYTGVITRDYRLGAVGDSAMSVGAGAKWTAGATFDGCARMKLAWIIDEKKLPNGVPSRYTQVVEGAPVYDPRRDSTVAGGSGTHRINDRTTWAYSTLDPNGVPIGRNNALQALWYLLGWTIPTKDAAGTVTGEMLVAGRGVDPQDINLSTFIAGANACEVAGYYTDMTLTTEDDHTSNEDKITCDGLIGRLIDPGGLWSYYANVDDTANIAVELTDADILEGVNVTWNEFRPMADQFNQVGGKFAYPASPVLFQPFPYPLIRDATYETNLGVKRRKTQDFSQVLDSTLAQRLARLLLNQGQYQGEFNAGFMARAIRAQAWSVVRYTSERFGWTKLFRVWRHEISTDGGVGMLLKEIHPSIWTAGSVTAPVAPGLGVKYDPRLEIAASGVVVALEPMTGGGGELADGFRISWTAPPENVRRTEIRYRLVGTTFWLTAGPVARDVVTAVIGPLFSGAQYEAAVRHISVHEIAGPWVAVANFYLGTTGNVNYAAIQAAGGTAVWSNITGTGKPANNADVTAANIAAGIAGQAPTATNSDFSVVTGVTKPAAYANVGDNLILNAGLTNDTSRWGTPSNLTRVAVGVVGPYWNTAVGGPAGTVYANDGALHPVNGAKVLFPSVWVYGAGTLSYCRMIVYFYDGSGNLVAGGEIIRDHYVAGGVVNTFAMIDGAPITVPELATYFLVLMNGQPNNGNYIAFAAPRLAATQRAADVTGLIVGNPVTSLSASSTGVLDVGEVSKTAQFALNIAGANVTSGVTWSVALISGGGTYSITTNGLLSWSEASGALADENELKITATAPGSPTRYFTHKVEKKKAAPPINGSAGGGTPANVGVSLSSNTTSMAVCTPTEAVVTIGTAGTANYQLNIQIDTTVNAVFTVEEFALVQWWSGAAWVDQGTETASNPDLQRSYDGEFANYYTINQGVIAITGSKTGLTAASSQKFRAVGRSAAGNTRVLNYTGWFLVQG